MLKSRRRERGSSRRNIQTTRHTDKHRQPCPHIIIHCRCKKVSIFMFIFYDLTNQWEFSPKKSFLCDVIIILSYKWHTPRYVCLQSSEGLETAQLRWAISNSWGQFINRTIASQQTFHVIILVIYNVIYLYLNAISDATSSRPCKVNSRPLSSFRNTCIHFKFVSLVKSAKAMHPYLVYAPFLTVLTTCTF